MATTIYSGFNGLKNNLEITSLQTTDVSGRHIRIRNIMKTKLIVLEDFLTGSYMRNTMISPLSKADVDIFSSSTEATFRQMGRYLY